MRFSYFPRTKAPPPLVHEITAVFCKHRSKIGTESRKKGLTSDRVLAILRKDLEKIGFQVEKGKRKADKIERPVFFGENGAPTLRYEIDAYHEGWCCGLEVEAGRSWLGNAIYRDLMQASVMVGIEILTIGLPLSYRYMNAGRPASVPAYEKSIQVAEAIYGHTRMRLPYELLLIGY